MPLCFAHAPSSAWNVLPLLNLPPRWNLPRPSMSCSVAASSVQASSPTPFQVGRTTLCPAPKHSFHTPHFKEFWLVFHMSFWLMRW